MDVSGSERYVSDSGGVAASDNWLTAQLRYLGSTGDTKAARCVKKTVIVGEKKLVEIRFLYVEFCSGN